MFIVFSMVFQFFWSYFCFLMLFWLSILCQQINYWFSEKMRKSKKHQKTKILAWIMKKWYDFVVFPHYFLIFDNELSDVRSGKIIYESVLKNPFLDPRQITDWLITLFLLREILPAHWKCRRFALPALHVEIVIALVGLGGTFGLVERARVTRSVTSAERKSYNNKISNIFTINL